MEPRAGKPQDRLDLSGVKILVVEDDEDGRCMLERMVRVFGAHALSAASAEHALAMAAEIPPDLVLCDLQMPGMDGYEFLERLWRDERSPRARVIVVSGHDSREKSWRAGFSGHLLKPIDPDTIEAELRRVCWLHALPSDSQANTRASD